MGNKNAFGSCTETILNECGGIDTGCGGGDRGGATVDLQESEGTVVVVGVKLDGKSKELLTWALVKISQCGDRVVALHVLDPQTDKVELLLLVKEFDSVLAAYEGFCNLKQIDLKLKVCRGTPVHKVLAREVKSCGATSLILGPSEVPHTIRSTVSVAKSCAKNLPKSVSVIAVDNGKLLFERQAPTKNPSESQSLKGTGKRSKRRKLVGKSRLSLQSPTASNEDSCSDIVDNSMALVLYNSQETSLEEPESRPGWTFLRRVFKHRSVSENSSPKKSIVKKWSVCPYEKHVERNDDSSNLDGESSTAIVVGPEPQNAPACDDSYILPKELVGLSQKYSSMCRLFLYEELLSTTSNFQPENLIGRGGSSLVYRGCLPDDTELAVKILKTSEDAFKQYVSEIEIVTSLNHKNIISLYGFCYEDNNLLLVYDLVAKGSLEENLHGANNLKSSLGWAIRYKVAIGVAEALDHLHNASTKPIIHRDVKSSNILLSDDFEPLLSDFGLARFASNSSCDMMSYDVAGTFGYLAPEYFMHGRLDEMIDVYAFGVVLLELLSGRKPIDTKNEKGQESLVMWAKQILRCGETLQFLDPDLSHSYDHDQFENMVLAATLCIQQAPGLRPKMSKVLKLLQGDPEVVNCTEQQVNSSEVTAAIDEQSPQKIESFLNLALLNLEDDSISTSSTDQMISVEDYLQGRWSRTSSFD
ncbi:hypothetical protein Leryth_006850 [Lithospermum erythrorhizon]|nr:hypothetical protein Leryth_006850 [Lithospermum erythrorhizon]